MTTHQQKTKKQEDTVELGTVREIASKKTTNTVDGSDMIIDPELDKFSGDEFIPEKYNEAGTILANSVLPHSASSSK